MAEYVSYPRGPGLRRRAEAAGAGGGLPRPGRGLRAAVAPSRPTRRKSTSARSWSGWRGRTSSASCSACGCLLSGKAVHRVSLSGGQEAFLEGHVPAFRVLGGVPAGQIRYDNLKAAVAQVLGLSRATGRGRAVDRVPLAF